MIFSFKHKALEALWISGDITILPTAYLHEVIAILDLLDASEDINDLALLGGFRIEKIKQHTWSVTISVNGFETIGNITCLFKKNNAEAVDLNEYD